MSGYAELHDELRAVARDLLSSHRPGGSDAAPPVPATVLAEVGWLGLEVPEAFGGAGATFAETAVVLEEVGRAAATTPLFGSAVLGVAALRAAAPSPRRDELLGSVADGSVTVAVALDAGVDGGISGPPPFSARTTGDRAAGTTEQQVVLDGAARFVADLPHAAVVLCVAALDDVPVLVEVDLDDPSAAVSSTPVVDATRALGNLRLDGYRVTSGALHHLDSDGSAAVELLRSRAATALACDSLGLARAMLDATVAYAGERVQFDRPIGSFQAVKHACADMAVAVAVAEQLVGSAVASCAEGRDDAAVAAAMAKSHVCAAAVEVAGTAMQLHGGIGYTWESGIHAYLKRAMFDRSYCGSPSAHRRWLAGRLREPAPPTPIDAPVS